MITRWVLAATPVGTLRPLTAFGIKANPGTKMPYIDVKPTTYACDEDRMVEILKNCDMSLVIKIWE